jgi:hypothetical protein
MVATEVAKVCMYCKLFKAKILIYGAPVPYLIYGEIPYLYFKGQFA